jgi:hypothetical protein
MNEMKDTHGQLFHSRLDILKERSRIPIDTCEMSRSSDRLAFIDLVQFKVVINSDGTDSFGLKPVQG